MSNRINESSDVAAAGATLLLSGFVTSALFLVAASILWVGLLIAGALGGSDHRPNGGEGARGLITFLNAAMFYIWGIYGLGKSRKALRAALAAKESADSRT